MLISELVKIPLPQETREPTPILVNSDVYIGIEIEAEKVTSMRLPTRLNKFWTVKEDGSLKDHGAEYTFNRPLRGHTAVESIHSMGTYLSRTSAICNGRTGLHVHIDVRALTIDQLSILLSLYALTERPLLTFSGEDRKNSVFCRPITESSELDTFTWLFNNKDAGAIYVGKLRQASKYSALNLASIRRFGSIEFRQHYGTYNAHRIILWVNMLLSLYNKALELAAMPDPKEMVHRLASMRGEDILKEVYGKFAERLRYSSDTDLYKCIAAASDMLFNIQRERRQIKKLTKAHIAIAEKLDADGNIKTGQKGQQRDAYQEAVAQMHVIANARRNGHTATLRTANNTTISWDTAPIGRVTPPMPVDRPEIDRSVMEINFDAARRLLDGEEER